MQPCARSDLIRVLPLGVAFNWAGKRRLIWDGRYVNAYLREEDFRIEMLQREGRTLFGDARYGGTVDVLAAYHHVHMRPDATLYLGFEWQGQFYPLFGAAIRPGHGPAVFYGGRGSHRPFSALRGGSGLPLFRVNFGRSDFRRHHGPGGRGSDGAQHPLAVRLARPPDQVRRVQRAYFLIRGTGYLDGPGGEVVFRPCQQALVLAQLGMGRGRGVRLGPGPRRGPPQGSHQFLVGGGRQRDPGPRPTATSFSRRDLRRSRSASVELSPACREEIRWWLYAVSTVRPSATFAQEPSFRWKDRRRQLHPSSGPCFGQPLRECPTTSSSSEPAAGLSP